MLLPAAVLLAIGAFLLHWLELQHELRLFSTELYVVIVASVFTVLGVWIGSRLGRGRPAATAFERNDTVIETLGLTDKELEVLQRVAEGGSNRQIADGLFVSVSTIKTHLVHIYQKLEVSRRTEAVQKARQLRIIA